MKNFYSLFISFILFKIFFIFIVVIIIYNLDTNFKSSNINSNYYFSTSDFFWPIPGYHNITSYFGERISPTTGASSNHSGIDIAAPEGTYIFSILSGKVIFTGFLRRKWTFYYY